MEFRERLQHALGSRYALERELGQGGMATVYLAEDLRHQRKVAVKILRADLAAALGPERFTREIRIAARLQHPHILPLLDSGEADGFLYYVMPYVDGQSLRDRIAREGELPVNDALRILVEIVDALVHAHGQGVVHRDIKPDNVMLSGRHALVMDFGVARAVSEATGRQALTTAGVALGTPAYMAPEQATADPNIDARVDLYAVGVVAYELLTGRTPFAGLSPQQTLAAHVTETPDPITRYRPSISPALAGVVMRCLAKHPADRWQSAEELLAQLEPLQTPSGGMTPAETRPVPAATLAPVPAWRGAGLRAAAALGILAVAVGVGLAMLGHGKSAAALTLGRRTQVTLDPGLELDPALSPDGRLIAYARGPVGAMKIFVRQLDGGNTIPVTAGVAGDLRKPRWSPDGSRIAYQSPRGIEIVPALGGQSRMLIESAPPDSATDLAWSPDGRRLLYRIGDTLYTRAADGARTATRVVGGFELHSPAWSPDGRWITFVSGNAPFVLGPGQLLGNLAPSTIMLVPAEGGAATAVTDTASLNISPVWLPIGRQLLFVSDRDGGRDVYRVSLDPSGKPVGAAERLTTGLNAHGISLSADGKRLAYSAFAQTSNVWSVHLSPSEPVSLSQAVPVTSGNQLIESIDVSHDGRWLAFDSNRNGNQDIFKMPLPNGEVQQLTDHPQDDFQPNWSPDDREIVYHSFRNGTRDVYIVPASGGEPRPVVATPFQDRDGAWSSDGRRIAFASNRSGRYELYLITRQGSGWSKPSQLTHKGGLYELWSPDGRAIMYTDAEARVRTVAPGGGDEVEIPLTGPLAGRQVDPAEYGWSEDSRSVLVALREDSTASQTVWSVPLGGGRPKLVMKVADGVSLIGRGSFLVHGGTLYFPLLHSESDIWTAELVSR